MSSNKSLMRDICFLIMYKHKDINLKQAVAIHHEVLKSHIEYDMEPHVI